MINLNNQNKNQFFKSINLKKLFLLYLINKLT